MKFKYYLRGVGVGIMVAAIILSIAFARFKPQMSADEIRKEAKKLGMVEATEVNNNQKDEESGSNKDEKNISGGNSEAQGEDAEDKKIAENNQDDNKPDENKSDDDSDDEAESDDEKKVKFVVKGGEFSDVVSENLKDAGFIKNAERFNKWLMKHGYDSKIQPGVYYIKKGAKYKEIAETLTENND